MRRRYTILMLSLFIILVLPLIGKTDVTKSETHMKKEMKYSAQEPVFITHEDNFSYYGFSGNGSDSNPYILEGANITAVGSYTCISITNTNSHFIIKDTLVQGSTGHVSDLGIVFDNVTNGVIENCIVRERSDGISITASRNVTVKSSIIHNTIGSGMKLLECIDSNVTGNTIYNCGNGILGYMANSTLVSYNNISCINDGDGIYFQWTLNHEIYYNRIHHVSRAGIRIENATGALHNNLIHSCEQYGIWIHGSAHNNEIHHNQLGWSASNALDDGDSSNKWNSTDTGNSWSDWNESGFFDIQGSAGAVDYHPNLFSDYLSPIFSSSPNSMSFFESEIGHAVTWEYFDSYPGNLTLMMNDTQEMHQWWCDDSFILKLEGLSPGFYNYTLILTDAAGNIAESFVNVTVYADDIIPPIIPHQEDFSFEVANPFLEVVWKPTDKHPNHYWIFRDGNEIDSGNWASGENISWSPQFILPGIGVYNFTILVDDLGGNEASDTTWVTIEDTTSPIINNMDTVVFREGETGHQLNWTTFDLFLDYYEIHRDGILVRTNILNATHGSDTVIISLDGLEFGNYTYTCTIWDESGNSIDDNVDVIVFDGTNPTIDAPDDIAYIFGETGFNITWTPFDLHPAVYEIYYNGMLWVTVDWDGAEIVVPVDGLSIGAHTWICVVYDVGGNSAEDMVNVTVSWVPTRPTTTTTTTPSSVTTPSGTVSTTSVSITSSTYTTYTQPTSSTQIGTTTSTSSNTPLPNELIPLLIIALGVGSAVILIIIIIRGKKSSKG